jgi:Spy/CpxP family protein refolding chaperone
MKGYTKKIICLVVAFVMIAGPFAYAEFGERHPGTKTEKGGKMMDKLMRDLDLTDEQREKVEKQREESRERTKPLREEMRQEREELREELGKKDPDREKLDLLIRDISDLREKMLREKVEGVLAMKGILSQEQFDWLQANIEEKRKTHQKGRNGKNGRKKL